MPGYTCIYGSGILQLLLCLLCKYFVVYELQCIWISPSADPRIFRGGVEVHSFPVTAPPPSQKNPFDLKIFLQGKNIFISFLEVKNVASQNVDVCMFG